MPQDKILVVDDETQMRKAITEALTRSGYRVKAFSSGGEAASYLEHHHCSLLITDMKMPGMTGLELLRRVKAVTPSIPVVVMTAFGTIHDAVEAMKLGAYDYLLKPFSLDDIEAVVWKALEHSKALDRVEAPATNGREGKEAKEFMTQDVTMKKILLFLEDVARSHSTILIQGESGTGKEILARMIHSKSSCAQGPFVAVNCAAIPDGLLESELFGHEKGAFSGAVTRKIGKFEQANTGTLLLDEIGEMELSLQAKLLRVLQEGEIDRIGGSRLIPINVRIIATTNRDLRKEVQEQRFREDLFYRLNVVPIQIPPLRERISDIPLLSEFFLKRYARRDGKRIKEISEAVLESLMGRAYPGNVRELENLIERAVLLCRGSTLLEENLVTPGHELQTGLGGSPTQKKISVRDMEQELILETLQKVHGNRTQASALLGISIRTLRNKLAEYKKAGIHVPPYEPSASSRKKKAALQCHEE